ncbi:hypothetical protein R84B8_01150 [Treponema sp. R8-4-B8]
MKNFHTKITKEQRTQRRERALPEPVEGSVERFSVGLEKLNRKNSTQKLNEVYNDDYYKEFEPISNTALESIRELTKNDTW